MNNTNQPARRRFDADFTVGARIRQMRNLLGRSQMDVAAALGLTFQQLQNMRRHKTEYLPAGSTSLPLNIPAR